MNWRHQAIQREEGSRPDVPEITPIYVIGSAHSGTTILYRMISLHPDTMWLSQLSQRSGMVPGRLRFPFHNRVDRFLRRRTKFDWHKEMGPINRFIVPLPVEAARTWEHIIPTETMIPTTESIVRLRRVIESEKRFWGRPFFVTKIPRLYEHMDVLLDAYPQSVFVHIVRDGRAVALSNRRRGVILGFSPAEALRWSAKQWTHVLREVQSHQNAARIVTVRYEHLCLDVTREMNKVLTFCGLDPAKFPYERCPDRLTPTNERRLLSATPEELKIVLEEQADDLRHLGYVVNGTD